MTFPTIASLGLTGLAGFTLVACGSPPSTVAEDAAPASDGGGSAPDAMPDAGIDAGTPDLTIYAPRTVVDLALEDRTFGEDACELDPSEDCIGAAGLRTLLRFSVETPNIGEGDFFLGTPSVEDPDFQYSSCHAHFHFLGYAVFRLLDADGMEVTAAQKQAFCLVDSQRYQNTPETPLGPTYHCAYQGLSRGWSDVYTSELPCQFIDVTDVTPGQYTLAVEVNTEGKIVELDTTNNLMEIPVDLEDVNLTTPTEACSAEVTGYASAHPSRECGWSEGTPLACTPGEMVRVGCAANCDLGACTGDAMLRVCDATRPDGNCSNGAAIGRGDNNCNSPCPRTDPFICPTSGQLSVWTASKLPTQLSTCTPAIETL